MPVFRTLPDWKNATFKGTQRHLSVTAAAALVLWISGCAPMSNQTDDAAATATAPSTASSATSAAAAAAASRAVGDPNSNSRWLRWGHQRAEGEAAAAKAKRSDEALTLEEFEAETQFVPDRNSDQRGLASWYGPGFHGRRTANGERFDQTELTAAHPTLAFGTRVCVRSAVNGKTVVVRINDRGPYTKSRVIDLSKAAAEELGMMGLGVKRVELWALEKGETECPGEEVTVARTRDTGKRTTAQRSTKQGGKPSATAAKGLHEDALRALEEYRQSQQPVKTAGK